MPTTDDGPPNEHHLAEARHAAAEKIRSALERREEKAARARAAGVRPMVSQVVRRAGSFEQTRNNGPRWERDHPVPTGALAALAQLEAHVSAKASARELPPATSESAAPPLPKRQKSSVEEKIRPLVDLLRELEEREAAGSATGAAQRCSSSATAAATAEDAGGAASAAELIERILGSRGWPDQRWRCLGLEPYAPPPRRAVLRKSFLALALRLHPDKCDLPGGREAFTLVERAFRELCEMDGQG